MTENADKAKSIFMSAIEKHSPDEWPAFLDGVCGDDAELRGRVEELLQAHQEMGSIHASEELPTIEHRSQEQHGDTIGPYKLLQQIGEGGMGIVFMAEQQQPVRRKVALKVIKPGMDTKQVIARFQAERQALALMEHPNVARVFDAGATESGRPYFVMELVKGVPITEYCDRNNLPTRQRLRLFSTVCRAVQHAHQKGIIHRDIKPSNIIVTLHDGKPVPKMIDFGISKAVSQQLTEKTLFTEYGQMVGTPQYMSPEQAEMSGLDIDTRTDIYSLGVLLYELLTGGTPFEADRLRRIGYAEIQRIITEEEPPRPSLRLSTLGGQLTVVAKHRSIEPHKLSQLIRGDLDWIVMRSLDKDRARRYETASSFAADVERYLRDEAVEACPPSAIYKLQKLVRRNRGTVATALALSAMLIFAVVGTSIGFFKARSAAVISQREAIRAGNAEQLAARRLIDVRRQRDLADEAREGAENSKAIAESRAEDARQAAFQADSLRLVAESTAALPTNPSLALLLGIEAAQHAPERGSAHNNALMTALRRTREQRTLTAPVVPFWRGDGGRILSGNAWTAVVSTRLCPDDQRLLVVVKRFSDPALQNRQRDNHPSAYVIDLPTGNVTAALTLPGHYFAATDISPDGRMLATTVEENVIANYDGKRFAYTDRAVRLWDLDTGEELRVLKGHTNRVTSVDFSDDGKQLVTASWDKTARIWDVETGSQQFLLSAENGTESLAYACFSLDGQRVVTMGAGFTRESLLDDEYSFDPDLPSTPADSIGVSNNYSSHFEGGSASRLWNANNGELISVLSQGDSEGASRRSDLTACVAFTPDGKGVVTRYSSTLKLWNAADGELISSANGKSIDDQQRRFLAASDSPALFVWQTEKTSQQKTWRRSAGFARSHEETSRLVLCSSTGGVPRIAVAEGDEVIVYDVATGDEVATLQGHENSVTCGTFTTDGSQLITGSADGTIRVWHLTSVDDYAFGLWHLTPVSKSAIGFGTAGMSVQGALFSPDGRKIITWGDQPNSAYSFSSESYSKGVVTLWDVATRAKLWTIKNPAEKSFPSSLAVTLSDVQISPDGSKIVTVHRDHNPRRTESQLPEASPRYTPVRIWDANTGELIFAPQGFKRSVATAQFSPDGNQLLTFSDGIDFWAVLDDKTNKVLTGYRHDSTKDESRVDIWDVNTGKLVRRLTDAQVGEGGFAIWSPDGRRVLTDVPQSYDYFASILNTETGALIRQLEPWPLRPDRCYVRLSSDGRRILAYEREVNQAAIWDAETGKIVAELTGHRGAIQSAAFSPDGKWIVTTSTDSSTRVWNAATGKHHKTLQGHQLTVNSVAFSGDGRWIVTAADDGVARIWDFGTGEQWVTLDADSPVVTARVSHARFSPDDRFVLTVSASGIRLWPRDPLAVAIERKPRDLTSQEQAHHRIGELDTLDL